MSIQISVVMATFNRAPLLRKCVAALESQTLEKGHFEVIVVDDGSTDDTLNFLESVSARTPLNLRYYSQANQGPAAARNRGVQEADGALIAFTDDDCIPSPDWLEMLLAALPDDELCVGIGGRIVRVRNRLASRYIDYTGSMQPRRHHLSGEIVYLITANALYRRSGLVEIGGFDTRITWPGGEDPDLSHRLRERGYYLASTDQAVVRHHHRDTIHGLYRTFWYYGRGHSARARYHGVPKEKWISYTNKQFAKRLARESLRYLVKSKDLAPIDRVGFSVLCLVHEIAFHVGRVSFLRTVEST